MTTEKKDIEIDIDKEIENILQLDIGEIDKELIYSKYKFDEENFPNFLDKVSAHFSPMDDNFYSDDSSWTEFFKSKARIYAFGEVASTQLETVEQVTSMNKETAPNKKDGNLVDTSIQAPPFRAQ